MSSKNGAWVTCVICGKLVYKSASRLKRVDAHCCSLECAKEYNRKRASEFCKTINPTRMTDEIREKISAANKKPDGEVRGYLYDKGKPIHRKVAEIMLGRELKPGEIVHHIDSDKHNNNPSNLQVLANTAEHNKLHPEKGRHKRNKGGDKNEL